MKTDINVIIKGSVAAIVLAGIYLGLLCLMLVISVALFTAFMIAVPALLIIKGARKCRYELWPRARWHLRYLFRGP